METLYLDPQSQPVEFVEAQYRQEFRYNIRVTRRRMGLSSPNPIL